MSKNLVGAWLAELYAEEKSAQDKGRPTKSLDREQDMPDRPGKVAIARAAAMCLFLVGCGGEAFTAAPAGVEAGPVVVVSQDAGDEPAEALTPDAAPDAPRFDAPMRDAMARVEASAEAETPESGPAPDVAIGGPSDGAARG